MAVKKCLCRAPKTHRDCMYCGSGWEPDICGVCKEGGIDGKLIRGTGRVVCAAHKRTDERLGHAGRPGKVGGQVTNDDFENVLDRAVRDGSITQAVRDTARKGRS